MRILLIEDDEGLASGLMQAFRERGWSTRWSALGAALASVARAEPFDIVLLDIGLPDIDGIRALQQARAQGLSTPILMLTARDAVTDRVTGLESGADDYLVKPFALAELVARMQVLVRRAAALGGDVLELGRLRMDRRARRAFIGDQPLELSHREWGVLELLLTEAERVVAKDQIVARLAGAGGEPSDNAAEVYVFRLRQKLADADVRVRTVRGFGYLLERARRPEP